MLDSRFWEDLWTRERRFTAEGGKAFRHGVHFVAVSSIAEQYYCEYKVENGFLLGEIPTESKDEGTALHDELLPTEEITKEGFAELVSERKPSLAVLRVWGDVGGLKVVGVPDHVIWSEGKPLWLLELKTTKGDPAPLWEDQENQARIYGLLLDLMGFDCKRLKLAVVRLKSEELGEDEKKQWAMKVSEALLEGKERELEARFPGSMKLHVLRHDRALAARAVDVKSGYWMEDSEPSSSTSVGKCRACEYNSVCPKSLYKP